MAAEANNDGNKIKWSFVMVVKGGCFLGVSWRTSIWVGCFYKNVGHRVSSCIYVGVFLGISYYLGETVF